jgi:hypothetical protein
LSSKNSMEMLMKKGKKKLRKITNAVKWILSQADHGA